MQLAELNIGRLRAPTDAPEVKEFMDNLDRINGLGKRMPGFVWMMEGSGEPGRGNTENNIGDDPQMVANLTVWQDFASLQAFVFKTLHAKFMQRRKEWFSPLGRPHFVMWWVEDGHQPSLDEALGKLALWTETGDTAEVFGWSYARTHFGALGQD